MTEALLEMRHHYCRDASPYAVYVAGIMKRGWISLEAHTIIVYPDGRWFIKAGRIAHQAVVDTLSTTIVAAGLRDSHAHIWGVELLPCFTKFGVTEVRDLGSPAVIRSRKEVIQPDCSHPYPRLIFGGPMLHRPGSTRLASAAHWSTISDIHRVLSQAVEAGAKWQKLYYGFPDQYIPEVIRWAHELGLQVAIHPRPGGAELAVDAGVDEIEHVACLAWDLVRIMNIQDSSTCDEHPVHQANRLWANEAMSQASPERFLRTGLCPTLVVQQQLLSCIQNDFCDAPNWVVSYWKRLPITQLWTMEQIKLAEAALEHMIQFIDRFVSLGGQLVIGSDTPNPGVIAGRSLWQELELLRKVGLSPLELYHQASVLPEGLTANGSADLVFISQERAIRAAAGESWGTDPVAGVLLRGCLYLNSLYEDGEK